MPGPTNIGVISTCVNQADAFGMLFKPSTGVDLTGSTVTCQVRRTAQPGTPILEPTVETSMVEDTEHPGVFNLQAIFSWTEAESAALVVQATLPTRYVDYVVEVDLALPDAPTEDIQRFAGTLRVHPGGNVAAAP